MLFPRPDLHFEPLSPANLMDLDFVASHGEMIGYSHSCSPPTTSRSYMDELTERRPYWRRLGIVAKIETTSAVKNLADIIVRVTSRQPFGGIIARGDHAVATCFARLAEMQGEIR